MEAKFQSVLFNVVEVITMSGYFVRKAFIFIDLVCTKKIKIILGDLIIVGAAGSIHKWHTLSASCRYSVLQNKKKKRKTESLKGSQSNPAETDANAHVYI